jgi:hypothetical protein
MMNHTLILSALLLLLLLGTTGLAAANGSEYTLTRWTVDGGGITNRTVGEYTLSGTIGQPDAGLLADDDYALGGGFWGGGGMPQYEVYLPLVLRNY